MPNYTLMLINTYYFQSFATLFIVQCTMHHQINHYFHLFKTYLSRTPTTEDLLEQSNVNSCRQMRHQKRLNQAAVKKSKENSNQIRLFCGHKLLLQTSRNSTQRKLEQQFQMILRQLTSVKTHPRRDKSHL